MIRLSRDNWVVLGILAAIITVTIAAVHVPQSRALESIRSQIVSQKRSLTADAKKTVVVPAMVRQVTLMKSRYKDFDRRLPKQIELGGFLREISENLSDENLDNQTIEPGNPERQKLFHTLPIIMRFQGSYLSLAGFLEQIDRMERLTRVPRLKITREPSEDALKVEVKLNIYFTES